MKLSDEKSSLRKKYRSDRKNYATDHSYSIVSQIQEFTDAKIIASYISYGVEPSTEELNQIILESGKTLLLPRIIQSALAEKNLGLEWVQWDGQTSSLAKNGNIFEPTGDAFVGTIDLIIVPALQIDFEGFRLGQGGGNYDRALVASNAWKIALIYPEEVSADLLPREVHDIAVNAYATPDTVVICN